MTQVKKKLTKQQIARALGISPAAFTKYVQRGCPLGSISEARDWQRRHVNPLQRILQHAGRMPAADPAAEVRRLMALAADDFDANADRLRAALRAVPQDARPGLLLNFEVMRRLLPAGLVNELGGGCDAPDDQEGDREYVAETIYGIACGELVWK